MRVLPVLLMVGALAAPASASAAGLDDQLGAEVDVTRASETTSISFVGTGPRVDVPLPAGVDSGDRPREIALAYAGELAPRFGLAGESASLEVLAVAGRAAGGTSVRLQQLDHGLPVIGGELAVSLDDDGSLRSIGGEASPEPVDSPVPQISADEAASTAVLATAKAHGVDPAGLVASEPELSVYDSRLLGGPGLEVPTLVWRTEVTPPRGGRADPRADPRRRGARQRRAPVQPDRGGDPHCLRRGTVT